MEPIAEPIPSLTLASPPAYERIARSHVGGGFSAAVLVAALAHGTALAGLLVALDAPYGHGGLERNAIDVSLVDASALERPEIEHVAGGNGAGADSRAADAIETASIPVKKTEVATPPDANATLTEDTVPPEAAPIVVAKEMAEKPLEAAESTDKPVNSEMQEQIAIATAQPSEAASPVPSLQAATSGSAPAAAPPGVAKDYARSVVKAIASSKPSGNGGSGIVHIAFSISTAGHLDDVRITKSSGSPKLDQTAIATVRRARFVPPPPGMTPQQLVYEMPFNFR